MGIFFKTSNADAQYQVLLLQTESSLVGAWVGFASMIQ